MASARAKQPASAGRKVRVKKFKKVTTARRGAVFFSNLPHGFYERALDGYLSQFGDIRRIKVAKSLKNAKPMGYAYVEFKHEKVALIVAKTMNKYLMFKKLLKCQFIKHEQLNNKMWAYYNITPELCPGTINKRRNQHILESKSCATFSLKKKIKGCKLENYLKHTMGIKLENDKDTPVLNAVTMEVDRDCAEISIKASPNVTKIEKNYESSSTSIRPLICDGDATTARTLSRKRSDSVGPVTKELFISGGNAKKLKIQNKEILEEKKTDDKKNPKVKASSKLKKSLVSQIVLKQAKSLKGNTRCSQTKSDFCETEKFVPSKNKNVASGKDKLSETDSFQASNTKAVCEIVDKTRKNRKSLPTNDKINQSQCLKPRKNIKKDFESKIIHKFKKSEIVNTNIVDLNRHTGNSSDNGLILKSKAKTGSNKDSINKNGQTSKTSANIKLKRKTSADSSKGDINVSITEKLNHRTQKLERANQNITGKVIASHQSLKSLKNDTQKLKESTCKPVDRNSNTVMKGHLNSVKRIVFSKAQKKATKIEKGIAIKTGTVGLKTHEKGSVKDSFQIKKMHRASLGSVSVSNPFEAKTPKPNKTRPKQMVHLPMSV